MAGLLSTSADAGGDGAAEEVVGGLLSGGGVGHDVDGELWGGELGGAWLLTAKQHAGLVAGLCHHGSGGDVASKMMMDEIRKAGAGGARRPPRRGRLASRVELHLAASAPLFAMLAWRLYDRFWWFAFFLLLAVAGAGVVVLVLGVARMRRQGDPFRFAEVVDLGDQVAGYVLSYLLPLLLPADPATGKCG